MQAISLATAGRLLCHRGPHGRGGDISRGITHSSISCSSRSFIIIVIVIIIIVIIRGEAASAAVSHCDDDDDNGSSTY